MTRLALFAACLVAVIASAPAFAGGLSQADLRNVQNALRHRCLARRIFRSVHCDIADVRGETFALCHVPGHRSAGALFLIRDDRGHPSVTPLNGKAIMTTLGLSALRAPHNARIRIVKRLSGPVDVVAAMAAFR